MAKIKNIGVLDVREIKEEVAEKITAIENIGIFIESDKSQILLKDAKKANVGMTLKIPSDKNISLVMQNGNLEVDKEYLEGIDNQVAFLVNGELIFKNDIDVNLLREKLFSILVNGELICPKKLSGTIQTKSTINGVLTVYSSDYTFVDGKIKLDNRFLKSMRKGSKLAIEKLLVLEPIDPKLLEERISNIEILGKLVILENLEDEISQYIDNYYSVNKEVIPNIDREIQYIDKDVLIDNNFINKYNEAVLYVDGKVKVDLEENTDFGKYIKLLLCVGITCNKKTYDLIKDNIGENVDVEVLEGNILENTGHMVLTGTIKEKVTIRNVGKLDIDEKLDMESFINNVLEIRNYGLIVAAEDKLPIVKEKVKINKGAISSAKERQEKAKAESKEEILYANMGELKL